MIGGRYTLLLHCEHPSHAIVFIMGEYLDLSCADGCGGKATQGGAVGIGEYHAANRKSAIAAAARAGWRLDLETFEAWCPAHGGQGHHGKKQNHGASP